MDFEQKLRDAGLSKPEIVVYLYLLEQGVSSPPQIFKGVHMARANTYNILTSLREKGLIDRQPRGKRHVYLANDPSSLVQNLETKKQAIAAALPDLRALYKAEKNKPTVKFLYGMEEIRDVFTEVGSAEEVLFIMTTNVLFEKYPKHFEKFRKDLAGRNIFVRDILTHESGVQISQETKETMRGFYDYRLFAKKYDDLPTSIRVWGDNVALVTFDEPAFGTVLTNAALAQTFRVMFETMWRAAEAPQREV